MTFLVKISKNRNGKMNLHLTNATFGFTPAKTSFCANDFYRQNKDCKDEIKDVLELIKESDNLFADIGTISKLSGYSAEVVYVCLYNPDNFELHALWQETLHKAVNIEQSKIQVRNSETKDVQNVQEQPKCTIEIPKKSIFITSPNKPQISSSGSQIEAKKIESAMKEILNNPEIEAEIENIAKITGLSVRTVSSKIYAPDSTLYNLWQYVESVKEDDTPERRRRLAKFYRIKDETVLKVQKKNSSLALKMLKHAAATGSKIKYGEIERASGLNREEIDELIISYAKTKQEQARLAQENKKLQAEWYKNNSAS